MTWESVRANYPLANQKTAVINPLFRLSGLGPWEYHWSLFGTAREETLRDLCFTAYFCKGSAAAIMSADSPATPGLKFAEDERLLCFHAGLYYEAKVYTRDCVLYGRHVRGGNKELNFIVSFLSS